MNKTTLHYAGFQPYASGFGWATLNKNLRTALGQYFELVEKDATVVFQPLADHDFNPVSDARGKINFAYTFFEYPLGPNAVRNAQKYDVVFAGSTWCLDRMAEAGITNGALLIQGVDYSVFKPSDRNRGQYRIFSGGKFEYRKGQDLVILAFREFLKTNPDAHLVCAWHNPWTTLVEDAIARAVSRGDQVMPSLIMPLMMTRGLEGFLEAFLKENGIPYDNFTILPKLNPQEMAREMANTDAGLFPNRCEGGTNLVLMEYLATGNPVAATGATGHADLIDAGANIEEIQSTPDEMGWAKMEVGEIVRAMQYVRAEGIREESPKWTWDATAKVVADYARKITG